ncbi:MAG: isoleucine--tRNA ligase [Candidatus Magasanikbacteria bacterium]|nr:isoleucine--tRNA ligase [Candidatus Magasanikbacteria bacterium]
MYDSNKEEQEILKYWEEHGSFEKSISSRSEGKPYHFYDGPPFATGLPHYGHIVASLMKDAVPRYYTMRGFRVERRWGWDCHGLPVENIIEKELELSSKKEIEDYGIDKFNEACRATVLKYAHKWEKTVRRMGRWVDMKNDYKTMDPSFMESVWWVFKQLWDRDLIYKDYKAMHICPRCSTTLSNFEVTQGYKDIKDISVIAKFKVKNPEKYNLPENTYILAWTTTPWTLPGNVLLAVNHDIEYLAVGIEGDDGKYIVARERVEEVMKDKKYKEVNRFKGADLVGIEYEPLFPYYKDTPNAFRVVAAEFVSVTDGTGIVHIAPAFGEEDFKVGKAEGLPLVQHVSMDGKFVKEVTDFVGMDVKPKDDNTKADVEIIKWLAHNGKLFSKEKIEHSYPHCWRCDTPLLNYATTSWFVSVTKIKEQLLQNNQKINWVPEHIKEGRFGQWLEGARDWAISRSRYWGTPLPVWECTSEKCEHRLVIGSVAEFEKLSGQKITDLHKHVIDGIEIPCQKCGGTMKRIPEVLDCWFESGSMPYGQMHYPFENKDKFEASFPAEFIAEGQDQTRGWFYTLHVLATALTMGDKPAISVKNSEPAFKNVIVNGIVLAEDGRKMSKRLKNYPEPEIVIEKYGADALRYYLITSPVMVAEALNFSEAGVREMYNKLINTLYNVLEFYKMFANESQKSKVKSQKSDSVLDKWILAKLQVLVKDVTDGMEAYKLVEASRPIVEFVTELSQWYVRRSRDRFKGDDEKDKQQALSTLYLVLSTLSKVMAPFTPFIAEKIYQEVGGDKESVHLEDWPEVDGYLLKGDGILEGMKTVREVVELGLAARAEAGIKIRQPLSAIYIGDLALVDGLAEVIADELNVKKVERGSGEGITKQTKDVVVTLSIEMTEELKKEGLLREIIRTINQIRKDQKLTISDRVSIKYHTKDELLQVVFVEYNDEIKKSVLADVVEEGEGGEEKEIDSMKVDILVEKL